MKTALIVFGSFLALLVAPTVHKSVPGKLEKTSEVVNVGTYAPEILPQLNSDLRENKPIKIFPVRKIITLEASNTVVFRGPVTAESVGKAMAELKAISSKVSHKTPIYLVLDTPGGSVFDGLDFIDFTKALPQEVHTVTLFAASMGFQIAQNLNRRYITRNGILMSHRASLSGLTGQIDGEFETRYRMIKRAVDYLDVRAASRMKLSVKTYKSMIYNEYWVRGFDAPRENAADQQIMLRCGKSLDGESIEYVQSFFGMVRLTFSNCPMIRAPLKVDFSGLVSGIEDPQNFKNNFMMAFTNQSRFVERFVVNNEFRKIFP